MENLFIIIGLGNPGKKYENTRHNVGFITIDYLASKYGVSVTKLKHKALYGDGSIAGNRVILVKPQTFMNLSGESVREIIEWYKAPMSNIVLVYDDIDLAVGRIRVRPKGSAGTHNGMRSVLYQIRSDEFPRVRIGVGRPPEGWDLADFVLSRFGEDEKKAVEESVLKAAEAVTTIMESGVEAAMNKYNR